MTHRLAGSLLWPLLIALLVLAMTGCSRVPTSSTSSSAPPAVTLAPSPASARLAQTDPAVWAAVLFERAHCAWDWRRPLTAYIAAQQALAIPAYGNQLAARTDPVSWRREVVAGRQQVTCTVSRAQRLVGAPSTSTTVYVRMSVEEQVTSAMGSFDGGPKLAAWRVELVDRHWLVAGSFEGG